MVSSGGGSPKTPTTPSPTGAGSIPYGETAPFNPSYTSVLGSGWATPESIDAGLARGAAPSNPAAAAPPPGGGMPPPQQLQQMLQQAMAKANQANTIRQVQSGQLGGAVFGPGQLDRATLAQLMAQPRSNTGGGLGRASGGSARGGPGGFGGSSARGGRAY